MYDLVVSIVAWNVRDLLRQCLAAIFQSRPNLSVRIVVVDNLSPDDSAAMVRCEFPEVDLIESQQNLGFARANNLVLERYKGEAQHYLLLNPDTVVHPGALDELVMFLDEHPQCGIVGGKLVKPDGTLDWPCKRSFQTPRIFFYRALGLDRMFPRSRRFGRHHLTYLDESSTHEVEGVCGALLMIRAEALRQIGLMDERLFMYGDDLDWCFRAKAAGWKVYYYPKAVVTHYKSASSKKRSSRMIYWWYRATWMVYKKSLAPQYNHVTNGIVFVGMYSMLGVSLFVNLLRSAKALPSRK